MKLKAYYIQWDDVAMNGSTSTVWTDGRELNYIRDNIIGVKLRMKEIGFFPECYHWETPGKKPYNYMVDPEKTMRLAKMALQEYESNMDFQYINTYKGFITMEDRVTTGASALVDEVRKLKDAIEKENYPIMKKYSDCEKMSKLFRKCRREVKDLIEEYKELGDIEEFKTVDKKEKIPF